MNDVNKLRVTCVNVNDFVVVAVASGKFRRRSRLAVSGSGTRRSDVSVNSRRIKASVWNSDVKPEFVERVWNPTT